MSFQRLSVAILSLSAIVLMAGCSANFDPLDGTTPPQTPLGNLQGSVFGGRAPISGAQIYVFQVGTGGYGGTGIAAATTNASKSVLTSVSTGTNATTLSTTGATTGDYYVTTDANGNFNLGGANADYTCTAGSVVYLYSLGGVTLNGTVNGSGGTGTGVPNPQAGLMAVLGTCPAGGTFAGVISGFIFMNEVSTVAAAYSLSGFATDPVHISSSGTPLAIVGVQNAGQSSLNLFNLFSPQGSQFLGNTGANATTPAGNGTVPQTELNTLANILVACMNTANIATSTSQQCNNLRAYATSTGTAGTVETAGYTGTFPTGEPSDTAQAMINIAQHAASNVANLCALQGSGAAAVYTPDLTCAGQDNGTPYTWTVDISYSGISEIMYLAPKSLSVDGSGNIWYADQQGSATAAGTLDKFNTVGAYLTSYTTDILPISSSVDTAGNIWVADGESNDLTEVTAAGVASNISAGLGLDLPVDVEFDGSGNMFIANGGGNNVVKATSAAVYTAKTTASANGQDFPGAVALEPGTAGNLWSASEGSQYGSYFTNALATVSDKSITSAKYTLGDVAVDATGNAWFVQTDASSDTTALACNTYKLTTANIGTAYNPGVSQAYAAEYDAVKVDGASNIWSTDDDNGVIYEETNGGVKLTGAYGIVPAGSTGYGSTTTELPGSFPDSIAVDGSGNVWYTLEAIDTSGDITGATLHELVGAGVPVVTPLAVGAKNSTLGKTP